jgi:hypothetical protein
MPNPKHEFTLVLAGVSKVSDAIEDALYMACDDALLVSGGGAVCLDFTRRAISFREAVTSAIKDVERAGFTVDHVEPDEFVTMAQIARRANRSRESIRQLVGGLRGPGGFPAPAANATQRSPIYRWTEVEEWLSKVVKEAGAARRPAETVKISQGVALYSGKLVKAINAALQLRSIGRQQAQKLLQELDFHSAPKEVDKRATAK